MTNNTVNILGVPYTVAHVPYISKEEYTLGYIDYEKQKISIDADLSEEKAAITLLHEVIHGILNELNFVEENRNEHLVHGLALSLRMCLDSNPSLFNITKPKKGVRMNKKQTSPKVATKGAKALRDGRTGDLTKTLAGTAVSQARGKRHSKGSK
jgi:hypothetical protein